MGSDNSHPKNNDYVGMFGIIFGLLTIANIVSSSYDRWWFYILSGLVLIFFGYLRLQNRAKKIYYVLIIGLIIFLIAYKYIEYRYRY